MRNINFTLFSILLLLLTGCAFATYQAPINYRYTPVKEESASFQNVAMNVETFIDSRHINNPKMIINMVNEYGQTTTGGYLAEKPVAEVIKDALIQGLQSKGINIDKTASKTIEGELLDVSPEAIMGFWTGKFAIKITVKLSIKDGKTAKILWRDTYVSKAETKCTLGGIPVVQKAFTAALDDLIVKIMSDSLFLEQIK